VSSRRLNDASRQKTRWRTGICVEAGRRCCLAPNIAAGLGARRLHVAAYAGRHLCLECPRDTIAKNAILLAGLHLRTRPRFPRSWAYMRLCAREIKGVVRRTTLCQRCSKTLFPVLGRPDCVVFAADSRRRPGAGGGFMTHRRGHLLTGIFLGKSYVNPASAIAGGRRRAVAKDFASWSSKVVRARLHPCSCRRNIALDLQLLGACGIMQGPVSGARLVRACSPMVPGRRGPPVACGWGPPVSGGGSWIRRWRAMGAL